MVGILGRVGMVVGRERGRWLEGFSLGELEKGDGGEIITTSIPIANTMYVDLLGISGV